MATNHEMHKSFMRLFVYYILNKSLRNATFQALGAPGVYITWNTFQWFPKCLYVIFEPQLQQLRQTNQT